MQDDDIAVFLQIVASGSLTRAAKVMYRPKATVSHQLKRLEQELGASLFDRRQARIALNAAGQAFLPHAQTIRAACQQGRDVAQQIREGASDQISIATSVEFASNIVSSVFLDFMAEASDVRLMAMSYPRDALSEVCDLFDCTLYLGEPLAAGFQTMQARKLGSFRYSLYASPGYLQAHGTPRHPDDLLQHRLLVRREQSEPQSWSLVSPEGHARIEPPGRLMSNDPWIIKIAASKGQGICFIPDFFAAIEVAEGLLQNIMPEWKSEEVPLNALYASHRTDSQILMRMLDYAAANFRNIDKYLYRASP